MNAWAGELEARRVPRWLSSWGGYAVAYVLLNLFPLLRSYHLGFPRPVFVLDYFVVFLVERRLWRLVLASAVVLCDLVALELLGVFPATSVELRFVLENSTVAWWSVAREWWWVVPAAAFAAVSSVAVPAFTACRLGSRAAFLLCGILLLFADAVNGSLALFRRDEFLVRANIAGSQLGSLLFPYFRGQDLAFPLTAPPSAVRLSGVSHRELEAEGRGFLLVLVESLGSDGQERDLLQSLEGRGQLEFGLVRSKGATVLAEMREICAVEAMPASLGSSDWHSCLPALLSGRGWSTVGLHGYFGGMFRRDRWWPKAGLQRSIFGTDSMFASAPRCGTMFRGVCDSVMVEAAVRLASFPRSFVYLLTLDAHLPVERAGRPCVRRPLQSGHAVPGVVCRISELHFSTLRVLRAALAASPHPPAVLVVGDHPPPFSSADARDSYSRGVVPYWFWRPAPARTR